MVVLSLPGVNSRIAVLGHARILFPYLLSSTIQAVLTWSIAWNKCHQSHIEEYIKEILHVLDGTNTVAHGRNILLASGIKFGIVYNTRRPCVQIRIYIYIIKD